MPGSSAHLRRVRFLAPTVHTPPKLKDIGKYFSSTNHKYNERGYHLKDTSMEVERKKQKNKSNHRKSKNHK